MAEVVEEEEAEATEDQGQEAAEEEARRVGGEAHDRLHLPQHRAATDERAGAAGRRRSRGGAPARHTLPIRPLEHRGGDADALST